MLFSIFLNFFSVLVSLLQGFSVLIEKRNFIIATSRFSFTEQWRFWLRFITGEEFGLFLSSYGLKLFSLTFKINSVQIITSLLKSMLDLILGLFLFKLVFEPALLPKFRIEFCCSRLRVVVNRCAAASHFLFKLRKPSTPLRQQRPTDAQFVFRKRQQQTELTVDYATST